MKVLAEGVESREEYEFLRDNGIDLVQGFYLGRPQ
ncbi:EAL domain-containing protein [Lachnospira eligens]|nr:EAL domain-containing protein [Lachnospira eligens]RHK56757.1 EAL domain-containing protein [Lachnospira eligens]